MGRAPGERPAPARRHGPVHGACGTFYDVGRAAGPLLAGALIGLFGDQDFRAPFALIAAILVGSPFAFHFGFGSGKH